MSMPVEVKDPTRGVMSMPGEVKDPSRGVMCVTCCGLPSNCYGRRHNAAQSVLLTTSREGTIEQINEL